MEDFIVRDEDIPRLRGVCLEDLADMGCDDLSMIEHVHLMRIIRDVAAYSNRTIRLLMSGELQNRESCFISVQHESVARWLSDLYGIDRLDHEGREYGKREQGDVDKENLSWLRAKAHAL